MRLALLCLALLCLPLFTAAQAPPATDLFLVELTRTGDRLTAGTPRNLTDRDGYDNQPSFTPDGRFVLYTSQHGEQTDIYRLDLATGQARQLTRTPESEYSPTVIPNGDAFTVIQVEADGTQRLWEFNLAGTNPKLVLAGVKPVGYHAWSDNATVAMFVLGEPPTLQVADRWQGTASVREQNIGRSLHRVPGSQAISFVHKTGPEDWQIKRLAMDSQTTTPLTKTRPGREDYCWMPDGTILMGDGGTLWAWTTGATDWVQIAEFSGIQNITRCTVSPDGKQLVFVADRPR